MNFRSGAFLTGGLGEIGFTETLFSNSWPTDSRGISNWMAVLLKETAHLIN
jgi:hypothetical protein